LTKFNTVKLEIGSNSAAELLIESYRNLWVESDFVKSLAILKGRAWSSGSSVSSDEAGDLVTERGFKPYRPLIK